MYTGCSKNICIVLLKLYILFWIRNIYRMPKTCPTVIAYAHSIEMNKTSGAYSMCLKIYIRWCVYYTSIRLNCGISGQFACILSTVTHNSSRSVIFFSFHGWSQRTVVCFDWHYLIFFSLYLFLWLSISLFFSFLLTPGVSDYNARQTNIVRFDTYYLP